MSGRRKMIATLITVVATLALGVSAYLTWVTWQSGAVVGCTGESLFDCDDVLSSRWSKWFGLPVSLLGGMIYLAILGLCWPAAKRPQGLVTTGLLALALIAASAAVWFIGLQAIEMQKFCYFCLTVHCCGLVVGVLALLLFIDTSSVRSKDYGQMRTLLGVAAVDPAAVEAEDDIVEAPSPISLAHLLGALSFSAVGLAALMGGQLLSESTDIVAMEEVDFQPLAIEAPKDLTIEDEQVVIATDRPTGEGVGDEAKSQPESLSTLSSGPRHVRYKALAEAVEVNSMPLLGSSEASHVMLEMMDYTCDHCRKLHPHIHAALEFYGDQLAVMVHHVPLHKKCNKYVKVNHPGKKNACEFARLAIGVWELAPEKFPEYHHWLLKGAQPPNITRARARAMDLVGSAILRDKRLKTSTGERLAKQSTTFSQLKSGLPILLLTNGGLRGVPEESQKLFEYLEAKLGVEPRITTE